VSRSGAASAFAARACGSDQRSRRAALSRGLWAGLLEAARRAKQERSLASRARAASALAARARGSGQRSRRAPVSWHEGAGYAVARRARSSGGGRTRWSAGQAGFSL
jgi:hypothetical protein